MEDLCLLSYSNSVFQMNKLLFIIEVTNVSQLEVDLYYCWDIREHSNV